MCSLDQTHKDTVKRDEDMLNGSGEHHAPILGNTVKDEEDIIDLHTPDSMSRCSSTTALITSGPATVMGDDPGYQNLQLPETDGGLKLDKPSFEAAVKEAVQNEVVVRAGMNDWGRHVIELTDELRELVGLKVNTSSERLSASGSWSGCSSDCQSVGSASSIESTTSDSDDSNACENSSNSDSTTVSEKQRIQRAGTLQPERILEDPTHFWGNEYFVVKKSPLGGLGAFAARDLTYGEIILVETPILKTGLFGLLNVFDRLDIVDKKLYLSLAQFPKTDDCGLDLVTRIRNANSFEVRGGVAVFSIASRFNHACEAMRNVLYSHETLQDNQVIVCSIAKPLVPKGTELTVKYGSSVAVLMKNFGFRCRCGGCPEPLTDREAADIQKRWGWMPQNWDW